MVSFPLPATAGFCCLISGLMTPDECQAWITLSERGGFASAESDYPPSYRNNDRHVIDAPDRAAELGERIRPHAPRSITAGDGTWEFSGINERLRFCRYTAGQRFNLHQDGVHHRGHDCRSLLTVLIYLTDGADIAGGDTVFYAHGPDGAPFELGRVRPRAGSLLLFEHAIWHAGDAVTAGTKHVLRSDVLYRASKPGRTPAPGHQGYVWTLADLGDGATASGGRDAVIHIADRAGRPVRSLHGHAQSVLGLAALPARRLASVSRDRTLRVWDWSTGACEQIIMAHDTAVLDVVSLPGGRLATSGADGMVKLWHDGNAAGTLAGHTGWIWQLAAWPGGAIASASEDGTVRIWRDGQCTAVLAHDQPLRTLLVTNDAIWTGDTAGRIHAWTFGVTGWTCTTQFQAHRAAIRRLRQVGSGYIASCGEDRALRVWTHERRLAFETMHDNFVTDALGDGATIISSSYDGRILRHTLEATA